MEYRFRLARHELEGIGLSFFVLTVVLGWRLATGDWSVAAGFGSLIVALISLVCARNQPVAYEKTTKVD